ncbi:MAG: hypothetical protein AAF915_01895 [Cyanobacteria bacterium P01_D01_bin.50]
MKIESATDYIAIGSLLLATATSLAGVALWYAKAEKRKYGLERDFAHIKRNYEQIEQSLNTIFRELDHRFDAIEKDILEIKANFNKKQ